MDYCAALMGDIQTVIFLCIFSIIIIQIVYNPSTLRRRRQHYRSILHIYHKAKYTPKNKSRCVWVLYYILYIAL